MKALIAEDEPLQADSIRRMLLRERFDQESFQPVDIAENGAIALERIPNGYDLLVLDIKMPKVDGTEVIAAANRLDPVRRPIIVLVTAFPRDYDTAELAVKMGVQAIFTKPIMSLPALADEIRRLLRLRRQMTTALRHDSPKDCHWALALSREATAFVRVNGIVNFIDSCHSPLKGWDEFEAIEGADLADDLLHVTDLPRFMRERWIPLARRTGTQLYKQLFVGCIEKSLLATGALLSPDLRRLRISFAGPRESLAVPFELLHDNEYYLVLKHPFKRSVMGLSNRSSTSFADLRRQLEFRNEPMRILLVASDTEPPLAAVDLEIESLYQHLLAHLPPDRFQVDRLLTEEATYDEVVTRLQRCHYHIVHYAGHGGHDRRNPDQSSLFFWEKPKRQGKVRRLTANQLSTVLRAGGGCAELHFVYLSCCYGSSTGPVTTLLRDTHLGIADSLIVSGVPTVLGYRWAVSDAGAQKMAIAFYDSLIEQGEFDIALYQARCGVASDEEGKATGDWLSPILIVQG